VALAKLTFVFFFSQGDILFLVPCSGSVCSLLLCVETCGLISEHTFYDPCTYSLYNESPDEHVVRPAKIATSAILGD
jgi:hypothetical protein